MLTTNIHLSPEAQQLLIKAAASRNISVEDLASEIINEVIQDKLSSTTKDIKYNSKHQPTLAGTQPFIFYGMPEESGLPVDEWDMENE
jgi:hypothetical protein